MNLQVTTGHRRMYRHRDEAHQHASTAVVGPWLVDGNGWHVVVVELVCVFVSCTPVFFACYHPPEARISLDHAHLVQNCSEYCSLQLI